MRQEQGSNDRQVVLLEKNKPQQERAIKTYEGILVAAAQLLTEVGLERISTNQIAERAGVTVPALYRYFPNKYAVLNALGARLMDTQNQAFMHWHETHVAGQPAAAMMDSLEELLHVTYTTTRDMVGGVEIMHGMEALAPLQAVRLESHWVVTELFAQLWAEQYGITFTEEIGNRARIAVDLGFTAVRIALEDPRLEPQFVLREGALALRLYLAQIARDVGVELN